MKDREFHSETAGDLDPDTIMEGLDEAADDEPVGPRSVPDRVAGRLLITHDGFGVRAALRHMGIDVRLNTRADREEYRIPGREVGGADFGLKAEGDDARWHPVTHLFNKRLQEAIRANCVGRNKDGKHTAKNFSLPTLRANVMFACGLNEVDPFREWLESLPEWDKTPRLETWLWKHALNLAEETDDAVALARWASMAIPYLVVVRTMTRHAVKCDETPVLIGPQEAGKSSAIAWLLPPDVREWAFSDGLSFASTGKERMEIMNNRALVEISEFIGASRADVAMIKAFMSRVDDGTHRKPWREVVIPQIRRCALVGTSNPGASVAERSHRQPPLRGIERQGSPHRRWRRDEMAR